MVPAQNKTAVDGGIGMVKVRPRYASRGGVLISEMNFLNFYPLSSGLRLHIENERVAETPDQNLDLAFRDWGDLESLPGLRAKLRKRGKPIAAVRRATYCPQCRSHLPHYLAPLVRHKKRAQRRQQPTLFYSRYALSKKFWRKEFSQDDMQIN